MIWRIALGCLLLIGGLLALTACYPQDRPPPYVGPVSTIGSLYSLEGEFQYELTSSTNCGFIGNPIKVTLIITNTGTTIYTDTLPASIFDIHIRTRQPQIWRWSDTVSSTEQLRSIALAPTQSMKLEWHWTIDPALGLERFPPELAVEPIVRFRDGSGQIVESGQRQGLRVPLGRDPAIGICPDIKP